MYFYKILVFGRREPEEYATTYPLDINQMYARAPSPDSVLHHDLFRVLELVTKRQGLDGFEVVMGDNGRVIGRKMLKGAEIT